MTPEQYKQARRLMKKHRIFFEGPVEPAKWPSAHRVIFSNIRALGERKYIDHEERENNGLQKGLSEPMLLTELLESHPLRTSVSSKDEMRRDGD